MLPSSSGWSTDLWNDGILPQHYTTSQPRRHCESLKTRSKLFN